MMTGLIEDNIDSLMSVVCSLAAGCHPRQVEVRGVIVTQSCDIRWAEDGEEPHCYGVYLRVSDKADEKEHFAKHIEDFKDRSDARVFAMMVRRELNVELVDHTRKDGAT